MSVPNAVPQKFDISFIINCVMALDDQVLVFQTRFLTVFFSRTIVSGTVMQGAFDVPYSPVVFQFVVIQDFFEQEFPWGNFAQVKDGLPR